MKDKNCFKEFIKYSSLNVLGMIGLSCYILADTFFVAKGLGANGLAALNIALPIYSFIHGIGLMLGIGGATKYSISKGQCKMDKANFAFTSTVLLACVLSLILFGIGVFFSDRITLLLGADEEVFKMSKIYLQVILLFSPMFMFNSVLLCFIRNDHAPQLSMIAMISGSLSNIVLDYIFIFPFEMGIFGAVLATGFAPIISMLILSSFFIRKKNCFHLVKCKLSGQLIGGILSCGLPSLVAETSSGIVMIVFNTIILNLEGNIGVAAYGIIANITLVVLAIYSGIAQGIQPIISANYGFGKSVNVQAILRYALITSFIISGVIYSVVFFGARQITNIFNSEHNPLLQDIAMVGLKIYLIACVFAGVNIIMSVYFTSTEHSKPANIISILRGFIIIIPLAFLVSYLGGITGIWFAFPVTELIVCGIGIAFYVAFKDQDS